MTSIWLDSRHVAIRKYSAATTGTKSVLRIEIEVNDPHSLAYLLKDLAEAKDGMARERKATAETARETKRQPQAARAISRQKLLALPYFGSDDT